MKLQIAKFQKTCIGVLLLMFFISVSGAVAQSETIDDAAVATAWFNLQLELVRSTPGFSPPVASRVFGYTGVALYEAIVPGMPGYQSLVGQLNDLTKLPLPEQDMEYGWAAVANSALAAITRQLFPTAADADQAQIDALYEQIADEYRDVLAPDVFSRSEARGEDVANAIFAWSMTDGGHESYSRSFPADYIPPTGAGLWIPTPRSAGDPQPALQPYWGNNRPFVLESGEICLPPAPPVYSEEPGSAFYEEALEVYRTDQVLTQEQIDIAVFWADNPGATATPPGHSMAILTQILTQEEATLILAAEAYARMGMAVADSFIGCWHAKYIYNLARPVTYIQSLIDETWMPLVDTPPFPEYPSGHSVQSAAMATILAQLFGEAYPFTDQSHDDLGLVPRSFETFTEMANEAALSRLYGGIHFRSAIELGLEQGRCIGQQINAIVFQLH